MSSRRVTDEVEQLRESQETLHVSALEVDGGDSQEGPEPLPQCNHFGMHMPAERLLKHSLTARCGKATDMRLMGKDMEIS